LRRATLPGRSPGRECLTNAGFQDQQVMPRPIGVADDDPTRCRRVTDSSGYAAELRRPHEAPPEQRRQHLVGKFWVPRRTCNPPARETAIGKPRPPRRTTSVHGHRIPRVGRGMRVHEISESRHHRPRHSSLRPDHRLAAHARDTAGKTRRSNLRPGTRGGSPSRSPGCRTRQGPWVSFGSGRVSRDVSCGGHAPTWMWEAQAVGSCGHRSRSWRVTVCKAWAAVSPVAGLASTS